MAFTRGVPSDVSQLKKQALPGEPSYVFVMCVHGGGCVSCVSDMCIYVQCGDVCRVYACTCVIYGGRGGYVGGVCV